MAHNRLVFPENGSRDAAYEAQLKDIEAKGICPFCPEHLEEYKGELIVRRGRHWVVTKCKPAYKESIAHLLMISARHITRSTELSTDAQLECFQIISALVEEYQLKHYTVVMRNGESESGATVAHLHYHLVSAGTENITTRIG